MESAITAAENIRQRGIGGAYLQYQWEVLCKAWEVLAGQPRPLRAKVFKKTTVFKKLKLPTKCEGERSTYSFCLSAFVNDISVVTVSQECPCGMKTGTIASACYFRR